MSYEDTVKKWDDAARSPGAKAAIHPSGGLDEEAYEMSGFLAARKVLRQFPPTKFAHVLDYGCGDGRVLRHLCGRYRYASGYDTSEAMVTACIEECRQAYIISPRLRDFLTNAADADAVDAVFSFAVFIHHTQSVGATMLAGLAHTFRGATLALQIPLYEVAREPTSWTDVGVWTLPMLERAADAAGLRVERAYVSPGEFSYDRVGHAHNELQVLTRKP